MNITILTVGKIKEKFFRQAIDEYAKRLSGYAKVEQIEVKDEKEPNNASPKDLELIKEKEGQAILAKIKQQQYVITLEVNGEALTSVGLSQKIEMLMNRGSSDIVFVIGGSNGLGQAVKQRSNYELSFSNMTYPHQLMKVILLEQIYRAFKIMKGESYHK
ncbi:23S rRNA (pseudouridine(1915)-N(3))-methyltransferase RlmH [Abyssicoccus albus]|uniref:23S rRNA (pseudouridine(1915)-N(3))-methyltransferase RlmH n=1 Tax=Abyssicoccus albus TaxID=1817405 RepID=UPI00097E2B9F|nr:23S rRNA (pseudouridine(1915)-N(3))-methyltransferase RlmH [Abyssicoccus albus]AQL55441.1 23S rRNA (pseudouridine(1915)-N(3))-methyltransferase RlmH [Abyssicoccus albus]